MTKPTRPATPTLDQARAEQEAVLKHEQEVQQYERQQAADAFIAARQAEVARQTRCKIASQDAADEAAQAVKQLVAALDQYVAATELPLFQIKGHVANFLGAHGFQKYGSLDGRPSGFAPYATDTTTYLVAGLFPVAE